MKKNKVYDLRVSGVGTAFSCVDGSEFRSCTPVDSVKKYMTSTHILAFVVGIVSVPVFIVRNTPIL